MLGPGPPLFRIYRSVAIAHYMTCVDRVPWTCCADIYTLVICTGMKSAYSVMDARCPRC